MFYKILVIVFLFQLIFGYNANAQKEEVAKVNSCLNLLARYSDYWKKDSVGKNGVREIIGYEFLNKCNFIGEKWVNLIEYLGTPNHKFRIENTNVYRYRLNYYSDDMKDSGTMLLDIDVNKVGIITDFSIWEVDG